MVDSLRHRCPTGPAATKQSTWDRVATASDRQALTSSLIDATDKARLLSVTSPHSSDWLHALPLSGCGLRLDDRAIHIAVGLRLGANICEPHQCLCRASVDARGLHGLSCRGGNGRSARHHNLNDLVWRAMATADILAFKEPSGLLRTDKKRPDGVTHLPWKQGKCVTWDVTVSDTLAQSYVHETSQTPLTPCAAAEAAVERKTNKYSSLAQSYSFVPVAAETKGAINKDGVDFLSDTGRRITHSTDDHRKSSFLFQRLSMLIQRYNAVGLGYLRPHNPEDEM